VLEIVNLAYSRKPQMLTGLEVDSMARTVFNKMR
jgi:hypothetical protein